MPRGVAGLSASAEISTTRTRQGRATSRSARAKPSPSGRPTSTSAACGRSLGGLLQSLGHVARPPDHHVAPPRQDAGCEITEGGVVVDDEHRARHPLMVAASHRRRGRASPTSFSGWRSWRGAQPPGTLGEVSPIVPEEALVATIPVGQENSTPIELYYEDHGSGPVGRPAARLAARQPVLGTAAAPAAARRLPRDHVRPPRVRPVQPARQRVRLRHPRRRPGRGADRARPARRHPGRLLARHRRAGPLHRQARHRAAAGCVFIESLAPSFAKSDDNPQGVDQAGVDRRPAGDPRPTGSPGSPG